MLTGAKPNYAIAFDGEHFQVADYEGRQRLCCVVGALEFWSCAEL